MKKTFNDPVTKQPRTPKVVVGSMSDAMQEVYNDFYGDPDFIKNEWEYCSLQYKRAINQSFSKTADFESRMTIKRISTYWKSRLKALENALDSKLIEQLKST